MSNFDLWQGQKKPPFQFSWNDWGPTSGYGDVAAAIGRSHRSVGLACVFTTMVITGGFWVLCFSRFLPTAYFGVLIGLTMFVALAADLILLPALLSFFGSRRIDNAA